MREAVIVSTARTPIGKAYRGAFNNTLGQSLGAHAIKHAVQRAGVDAAEVEDVIMGAALQMGSSDPRQAKFVQAMAMAPDGCTVAVVTDQPFSGSVTVDVDSSTYSWEFI